MLDGFGPDAHLVGQGGVPVQHYPSPRILQVDPIGRRHAGRLAGSDEGIFPGSVPGVEEGTGEEEAM